MQKQVAVFEKVSLKEFTRAMTELFPKYLFVKDQLEIMLNEIPMPRRSTKGAAGYDFFAPFEFVLKPGTAIVIPTGIRVKFVNPENTDNDSLDNVSEWALLMMPKSGIGTKTSIHLSNTLGLIDCDYYQSDNEGHIFVKLEMPVSNSNLTGATLAGATKFGTSLDVLRKSYKFEEHCKFVQGVFVQYGITVDDDQYIKDDRNGGFGSTGDKTNENINNVKPGTSDDNATPGDPFTDENASEITKDDLLALLNS